MHLTGLTAITRLTVLLSGLLLLAVAAQANVYHGEEMDVELVSESANVVPGETLWVAVRLDPTEGWHTYSKWPGDSGDATFIHDWQLPEGATAGEIHWPLPEWLPFPGTDLVTFSYKDEVFLPVPIDVPSDISGDTFRVATHVEWQVCDLICLIGDAVVELELPVAGNTLEPHPQWAEAFARTRDN
jgi:DsbC/DsbD-like thiol-disulfide interchange protein